MRVGSKYVREWPGRDPRVDLRLRWGGKSLKEQLLPWPPLLLMREFGVNAGMSDMEIIKRCRQKVIPAAHRPGGGWFIPRNVLLTFLGYAPDLTFREQLMQSLVGWYRGQLVVIPPVIGIGDASGLLRTSPRKVRALLGAGVIAGRLTAHRWRIPTESILDALEQDSVGLR